ncbi:DUF305 domain-containing protein [Roseisolibacter sp. H3M3-2]|uniref:DUF305 domain-containing protein n=1 Tax=Roseisolibacter sp. H3M3-2 TaxID=3031323 RepID=UPI0023DC7D91|nr:DUF305 domain-containing protein [Roseisolibacter sp. H3M3-2]MDF1505049.1 DUF305 domain-containing protein [Roseisolibacter sp. H3M3-2]
MPSPTVLRLLALGVLAGCASGGASPRAAATAATTGALPPDSVRYATRYGFTDADVRFMTDMIGHHAQAVVMSRLAPERAASPSIRTLAARIINAQRDEIASMQTWLRDRGRPVPAPDTTAAALAHVGHDMGGAAGGHGDHAAMAGMLTPAQLRQLAEARGPVFDRLFLQFMIQHHRGATAMVEQLFATDGAGQDEGVFKLASDINVDQVTEIARMERMLLDVLTGGGAP